MTPAIPAALAWLTEVLANDTRVYMGLGTARKWVDWRSEVVRLLVLCCLVRAMVPVAFMPFMQVALDDGLHSVICTGNGVQTVTLPGDRAKSGNELPGSASHQCDLCSLTCIAQLPPPSFGALPAAPLSVPTGFLTAAKVFSISSLPLSPNVGPRGPPILS